MISHVVRPNQKKMSDTLRSAGTRSSMARPNVAQEYIPSGKTLAHHTPS